MDSTGTRMFDHAAWRHFGKISLACPTAIAVGIVCRATDLDEGRTHRPLRNSESSAVRLRAARYAKRRVNLCSNLWLEAQQITDAARYPTPSGSPTGRLL